MSQAGQAQVAKKKVGLFVWIIRIIFLPFWLLYEITKWGIRSIKAGGSQRIFGIAGIGAAWLLFLILLLGAGGKSNQQDPSASQSGIQASATAVQATATVTSTAAPTKTPQPTETPRPTSTPTQPTPPQVFSGNSDDVITINPVGPAIVDLEYSGGSNFIVQNYDSGGQLIDLLVNTIGSYSGRIEMDFIVGQDTSMIQVQASGPWSITITPYQDALLDMVSVPGTYQGNGDNILYLGGDPSIAKFEASGGSNFIVWAAGDSKELIVNEIAPYSGTVIVPGAPILLIIRAEGNWTVSLE